MIAHRARREQDEWFCYRCGKRWAVGEVEPPCAPLGQGKPMVTNEHGAPLNRAQKKDEPDADS